MVATTVPFPDLEDRLDTNASHMRNYLLVLNEIDKPLEVTEAMWTDAAFDSVDDDDQAIQDILDASDEHVDDETDTASGSIPTIKPGTTGKPGTADRPDTDETRGDT